MVETRRCAWAEGDAVMEAYHDAEWGVPQRDPRMMWEMLVLEGFQAGLSWRTILHRREGFRAAFDGFDPDSVASYDDGKIDALMRDARIIRARAKIAATITGARIYVAMRDAGEDFSGWLWGLAGGSPVRNDGVNVPAKTPTSDAISRALKGGVSSSWGRRSLMPGCRRSGWSTIMRRIASGATQFSGFGPKYAQGPDVTTRRIARIFNRRFRRIAQNSARPTLQGGV